MDSDFTISETPSNDVPAFLIRRVPELKDSTNFKSLAPELRGSPTLVCAALASTIVNSVELSPPNDSDAIQKRFLVRAFGAIEEMSSSTDHDINNLVVTEILETFNANQAAFARISSRLGQKTLALYRKWIE